MVGGEEAGWWWGRVGRVGGGGCPGGGGVSEGCRQGGGKQKVRSGWWVASAGAGERGQSDGVGAEGGWRGVARAAGARQGRHRAACAVLQCCSSCVLFCCTPPGSCCPPRRAAVTTKERRLLTTKGLGRGRSRWRREGHSSTSSEASGVSTCTPRQHMLGLESRARAAGGARRGVCPPVGARRRAVPHRTGQQLGTHLQAGGRRRQGPRCSARRRAGGCGEPRGGMHWRQPPPPPPPPLPPQLDPAAWPHLEIRH